MEKLNQKKFALASGTTSIVIYLGYFGDNGIVGKKYLSETL